jgi:hypothetical protein
MGIDQAGNNKTTGRIDDHVIWTGSHVFTHSIDPAAPNQNISLAVYCIG